MAGHFLFIYVLFVGGGLAEGGNDPARVALSELFGSLWPAILGMFVSHGLSFYKNFLGRKEYVGRGAAEQMMEPYRRIVILHLTILFGGGLVLMLGSPLPALLLLVVLKTVVDLAAHRKEHRRAVSAESSAGTLVTSA